MKLGVYYNFFDGEELLEGSILSLRNNVDYITIVYQNISNYGNQGTQTAFDLVQRLERDHIVNSIHFFEPETNKTPQENETRKRNIGLWMCQIAGCDHILGADADEYWDDQQFKKAKQRIIDEDIGASVCKMRTYFKLPIYQIVPPEEYFVPFIHRINRSSKYKFNCSYPVLVDPTRRIQCVDNLTVFERDELEMHHFSFVRRDIRSKLLNSSSRVNFDSKIDEYTQMFEQWKPGQTDFHPTNPSEFHDVIEVDNKFGIELW